MTASGNVVTGNISATNANITAMTASGVIDAGSLTATGNISTSTRLVSTLATGNAPLVVASTTKVDNLNADLLDGFNTAIGNTANTVAVRDSGGNITANFFIGNGSALTGLPSGTAIVNGTSNVNIAAANSNVTIGVAGTSNVVIVTATGVNVAGTLNTGTGNIIGGNISVTSANVTGLTATGAANVNSLTVVTTINATGNITGGNLIGRLANGTSNVNIPAANGNVTIGVGGTSNVVIVTATGVNVAGTLNTGTGNIIGGNISVTSANVTGLTATGAANVNSLTVVTTINATGNITGGNLIGALANGTSNVNIPAANGNVTIGVAGNANVVTVTGTGVVLNNGTINTGTGNITVGNISAVAGSFSGNLSGLNITTTGLVSATGNVSGGNLTTGGNVIATSGLVSSQTLSVSGTANVIGEFTANANVITNNILGRTASVTITAAGANTNINLIPQGTGTVDVANKRITSVATPTAATDAATKDYVDQVAQGLHVHTPVLVATPANLATITGGTITYNNGTAGVGANLVLAGNTYSLIDGVSVANVGTRILVKNESNAAHNGIFTYSNSTVLTRATDFDTPTEMAGGDFTFVQQGTLYNDTGWVMTDPVTIVGTSAVNWVQFSGAGTYSNGVGLGLNGTQFFIANTTVTTGNYGGSDLIATFSVNPQGQLTAAANVVIQANAGNLSGTTLNSGVVNSSLTSVGNLTSLNVVGNITAGNVIGTLANGNSNIAIPSPNGNINISAGGTPNEVVITNTGVNVAGTLTVAGNISGTNLTGTLLTAAQTNITSVGNLTALSIAPNGNITMSGTGSQLTGANLLSATNLTGTLTTAAQPNITSVGNLTSLNVTGNITGSNISTGGSANAATANISGNLILGNTTVTTVVSYASLTTTSVTANQTIAAFSTTGVTGVEYIVKGIDSTGARYSVATVQAVTDGTNVDYSTFGTVNLGGYTGALAVNVVGGQLRLQVTPASSNSTVWTTQYRFI